MASDAAEQRVNHIYWALRLTLGGTAFAAGLDKFFNRMVDWERYLSPALERRLPVSARTFMRGVGVIEMAVGSLILAKNPRGGALIAAAWLAGISANLVTEQDWYDIAARDVNMAVAALALAGAAEIRAARRNRTPADVRTRVTSPAAQAA
ncbi:MAG: hypothetical protein JO041_04835 [Acidobacteria bacterium]|nr:hypothetical protein [Acidobacteriota bacterium]